MKDRGYTIDAWGLGPRVAELWATGNRGRKIAKMILREVEAVCAGTGQEPPSVGALTMAVTRYMETDPADRRTKQARAQGAAVKQAEEQAVQIIRAQVDAAQTLQKYVERIDAEVSKLESVKEINPLTGDYVVPSMATYYGAMVGLSKEMRGWITLLVDIKDRLWQHEQYEKAYGTILTAVRQECPPDVLKRIVTRLREDPSVHAALRGLGGGG